MKLKKILKRLLTLTILLLSCCFKSWSQTNETFPFTGEVIINSDSTCVVPIHLLKKANVKLIERKAFADIICHQDTIIRLQKIQINQYSLVVTDMQNRILNENRINADLQNSIEQYKKRNKILIGTTCGMAAAVLVFILVK